MVLLDPGTVSGEFTTGRLAAPSVETSPEVAINHTRIGQVVAVLLPVLVSVCFPDAGWMHFDDPVVRQIEAPWSIGTGISPTVFPCASVSCN